MHAPLWAGFLIQSLALFVAVWLLTVPLILARRWYAVLAPALVALASLLLYVDSFLFDSLGFHFNAFVLQVALQPGTLDTTGLSALEVTTYVAIPVVLLGLDVWLGGRFIRWRMARAASGISGHRNRRRSWAWPWALGILALWVVERLSVGALAFYGGHAVLAAGTTLPLQPPVRMSGFLEKLTGKPPMFGEIRIRDLPQAGEAVGTLDPREVRLSRTPDVLFVLIESARSDFFVPEVMPHLSERAKGGRVFPHHYSGAPSTHFALFNLFFGLDAQRRDSIIGAGRAPLLFPALQANGYRTSLIASSTVDWMDLTETVFRDVKDDLITGIPGRAYHERDGNMLTKAQELISSLPAEEPLFLFLFFNGSHFNYSYPEESAIFEPAWDGKGSLKATTVDAELLKNRSRNSLYEVDRKLEAFLRFYEETRGGSPLLLVTADHGEEFREHGRVGHGSDVTREQIHVPMVIVDDEMPQGIDEGVTAHVDLVPTILTLLGDEHDPGLYSDGLPMQDGATDRYALSTVGWEPRFAVIGKELKVRFYSLDAGFGSVQLTDHEDRPLPDAKTRFGSDAMKLLQRLRGGLGQLGRRNAPKPEVKPQRDPTPLEIPAAVAGDDH